MELMDSGRIEEIWVDFEKFDEFVKLLDVGKRELFGFRKIMIGFFCKYVKYCYRLKNIIIILELQIKEYICNYYLCNGLKIDFSMF